MGLGMGKFDISSLSRCNIVHRGGWGVCLTRVRNGSHKRGTPRRGWLSGASVVREGSHQTATNRLLRMGRGMGRSDGLFPVRFPHPRAPHAPGSMMRG